MDLKIEEDWKKLIEDSCGNDGAITPTPLYTAIADLFPIALTHKLVIFACNNDLDHPTRQRAAFLLIDMAEADNPHRLDDAYPTVDRETTLPYLRNSSFRLLVDNERGSHFSLAGKALVKKLITLALRHDERWIEFLEWLQRGFSVEPLVLELILDVYCDLDFEMRVPFARFVDPILKLNHDRFRSGLMTLLEEADVDVNYRGFQILVCSYHVFFSNKNHQRSVMEAAIMSPIFDYDPHPNEEKMLSSAECIQFCIQFGTAFKCSSAMINKINHIILRLYNSSEPEGRGMSADLYNVIRSRLDW